MEEEKDEIHSPIRPISHHRSIFKLFLLPYPSSKNHGFTIIELLTVIAIIGILAGGLLVLINPVEQMKKTRDSKVKSNMLQIQTALELFRADCGSYPASLPVSPASLASSSSNCPDYSGFPTTYIQTMPSFPSVLIYTPVAGNSSYTMTSCLENRNEELGNGVITYSCASGSNRAFQVTSP